MISDNDDLARMERLRALRRSGVLSEEEFAKLEASIVPSQAMMEQAASMEPVASYPISRATRSATWPIVLAAVAIVAGGSAFVWSRYVGLDRSALASSIEPRIDKPALAASSPPSQAAPDQAPVGPASGREVVDQNTPGNEAAASMQQDQMPPHIAETSQPRSDAKVQYSAEYGQCMASGDAARGTTMGILDCMGQENARQDVRLNQAYKLAMQPSSEVSQTTLRQSERLWLKDREATCTADASPFEGGTQQRISYAQCLMDETIKRTSWLQSISGDTSGTPQTP